MPYGYTKSKEISNRANEIGIYEAALEFAITKDSVKRAMRNVNQTEGAPHDEATRNECCVTGGKTVLVIGDLHCPFDLEEYHEFVCGVADEYKPDHIVFIGDVIDNHFSSYHETDADGMGGGDELEQAVEHLKRWHTSFPDAYVTIGNHDRMVMRKSQTSHVPRRWIKSYAEVLETPGWYFTDRVDIDGVQYIHGEAGTARSKCKADMMSTVQGHLHTQCYTEWVVGRNMRIFGMQVGCGIDDSSYAMAYAKAGKKSAIGCGIVIDGQTAINKLMDL
jgi:metallophosphoesterase superfamily enzyme